ncbi:MAG: hypothetical protein H7833_07910 [Magnetococcus sp. DMHC-1]|nr:CRISPR-associated protein Csm7 [Magnetococcales bacterium]
MKTLLVTIEPLTAFATPLHGDTLFGQLCWALRNRHGDAWLKERLQDYTQGKPFLVVSDIFPAGYWPRPHLPPPRQPDQEVGKAGKKHGENRKMDKKRVWLPSRKMKRSLADWIKECRSEQEIWFTSDRKECKAGRIERPQPHNSINRLTGTTGKNGFAPYAVEQTWFPPDTLLDLWLLHDPARLSQSELIGALCDVGLSGFGKDASTGLGKFSVEQNEISEEPLPRQEQSNAWLTLGFCTPQRCGFNSSRSFYQVFTRFGRHGDVAALTGNVFKSPILLAKAGAVLTPNEKMIDVLFVGQGLGGDGNLSKVVRETVHQGYAPVVGIQVDWESDKP